MREREREREREMGRDEDRKRGVTQRQTDRQTDRHRERERELRTFKYYTRIKILGSCPFLQSVSANLHANRLHIKQ